MPMADTKKVQSLIQYENGAQDLVEEGIARMDTGKSKFQTHSPDLTGTKLNTQQVAAWNAYHNALKQAQVDHAAIIAKIRSEHQPSHDVDALD